MARENVSGEQNGSVTVDAIEEDTIASPPQSAPAARPGADQGDPVDDDTVAGPRAPGIETNVGPGALDVGDDEATIARPRRRERAAERMQMRGHLLAQRPAKTKLDVAGIALTIGIDQRTAWTSFQGLRNCHWALLEQKPVGAGTVDTGSAWRLAAWNVGP